jgi:hypothetical protein
MISWAAADEGRVQPPRYHYDPVQVWYDHIRVEKMLDFTPCII